MVKDSLPQALKVQVARRGNLPVGLDPIENVHLVPKKQWKKWNERQRRRFNQMFELACDHPEFFTHPKAKYILPHYWVTTAWNFAFIAACEEGV